MPGKMGIGPEVIITVSIFCAETTEQSRNIARSSIIWGIQKEKGEGKNGIPSIKEAAEDPLSIQEKELVAKMEKRMSLEIQKKLGKKYLSNGRNTRREKS
ncbi:hypothetical protein J6TS1_50980 [Siminovitchia terrae]|uniref:Uncharacterized protein n=1 Tax=Siminovitchia terrae TaxID=1914933 RepID=A0ABQ4L4M4_SIMTE|nr:hypothetical protein [Siminovitchia terrae]GIN99228.1 hypothetical protein J6TS1_50980 [Siminovitchia terrae]